MACGEGAIGVVEGGGLRMAHKQPSCNGEDTTAS
jgi:hypothetical protein